MGLASTVTVTGPQGLPLADAAEGGVFKIGRPSSLANTEVPWRACMAAPWVEVLAAPSGNEEEEREEERALVKERVRRRVSA